MGEEKTPAATRRFAREKPRDKTGVIFVCSVLSSSLLSLDLRKKERKKERKEGRKKDRERERESESECVCV